VSLKNSAFFASLLLTRLGDQVLLFLVPLVIYQMTGSVSLTGFAFFAETLPRFLAAPVSGVLCDRFSPLLLLRRSQFLRMLACLIGVGGIALTGGVWWLIGLGAVSGVLTTQGIIAREVILPRAFPDLPFPAVASYASLADQLGAVAGPLVAALLLALMPWQAVVVITAVLFLLADGALILWQRQAKPDLPDPAPVSGNWIAPFILAAKLIASLPGLPGVILLTALVNLVLGAVTGTAAVMVTGYYGQGEGFYGALQSAGAVATVIILLVLARVPMGLKPMGIASYILICLGGLASGWPGNIWIYAAGYVLVIGFDKMFAVYIRTLRQQILPPKDFGKTTGLIVVLNNLTQPLAGLLIAVTHTPDEARHLLLVIGCGMAVVGMVALLFSPRLRRREV
jgi:MFS family permease